MKFLARIIRWHNWERKKVWEKFNSKHKLGKDQNEQNKFIGNGTEGLCHKEKEEVEMTIDSESDWDNWTGTEEEEEGTEDEEKERMIKIENLIAILARLRELKK